MPYTVVNVPVGGSLEIGYSIMDMDTGSCNDSGDPGCDDLVCDGLLSIGEDSPDNALDYHRESTLTSENGRCRVTYSFGPAAGSPLGTGVPGWEPMPWIDVEDVIIDQATGRVAVPIRNTGSAAWPRHDLQVELQTRSGESLGISTFENYTIEAGQHAVLHPDILLEPPYDACVLVDPNNLVMEEFEAHGILYHSPVCPVLPDLVIDDVHFDAAGGGQLFVTVTNTGEARLDDRTLKLQVFLPDGSPAYLFSSWPNVSLNPNESQDFCSG